MTNGATIATAEFESVIGLEIHAELATRSKMYCSCPVLELLDAEPNTAVCHVCGGLPGALPVVNRRAVECAIQVALALNCQVREFLQFARKNYFYPDLPKGYQLSQHEYPIGYDGHVDVPLGNGETTRVRIRRVHLEEDTAKLLHGSAPNTTLIDFNRAGVPLLEIVTEPDIRSAEVAMAYASVVRDAVRYLGVNSGDMEKGVFRLEANISVRPRGDSRLYTRTEVKNLNSFRAMGRSIELEVARQSDLVRAGRSVLQQTLGWDKERDRLVPQRTKENADDYRYFPEPDLPAAPVATAWVERLRAGLPVLPWVRHARYRDELGLPDADAEQLAADRGMAEFFEAVVAANIPAKTAANWLLGDLRRLLNENREAVIGAQPTAEQFAEIIQLVLGGEITANNGKVVLETVFQSGEAPRDIVTRLGMKRLDDVDALSRIAEQVVQENPDQTAQYLAGKEAVFQWLLGRLMRATKGQADAARAREALTAALAKAASGN